MTRSTDAPAFVKCQSGRRLAVESSDLRRGKQGRLPARESSLLANAFGVRSYLLLCSAKTFGVQNSGTQKETKVIGTASKSFNQLIVGFVAADPKPLEDTATLSRESAIMVPDANPPDVAAQGHELERTMAGIVRKQLKLFVRKPLCRAWQFLVASPEGFARDVPHGRLKPCLTSPVAISASSCSSTGRRRPASMSSIIWRSHASVFPSSQSLSSKSSSAGSDSISFFTSSSCGLTCQSVAELRFSGKDSRPTLHTKSSASVLRPLFSSLPSVQNSKTPRGTCRADMSRRSLVRRRKPCAKAAVFCLLARERSCIQFRFDQANA